MSVNMLAHLQLNPSFKDHQKNREDKKKVVMGGVETEVVPGQGFHLHGNIKGKASESGPKRGVALGQQFIDVETQREGFHKKCSINPFTAPACKLYGLKSARSCMCVHTHTHASPANNIFQSYKFKPICFQYCTF